jgi:alkanesulfonate monooxygenase SsuD/methylene tetrahydromethanopterin reductase-like flavin-dependent oxidoreductase (luciferase family)
MAMTFAISYSTPFSGVDPDRIVAYARHAEDCGFEAFYLPEHIALYPGAMLGTYALPPDLAYLDPLDTLSFVAAATERIRLGTGVLLLPIHVGGSSRAAARRAGRRGDGFFPGGALAPEVPALAFSEAAAAGRGPLEYTRWGSIDMSVERAAAFAAQGVTRVVVAAGSADPAEQRDQMSAFAARFGLGAPADRSGLL